MIAIFGNCVKAFFMFLFKKSRTMFFSTEKVKYVIILSKSGLGYNLEDFFTNSSGHSVSFAKSKVSIDSYANTYLHTDVHILPSSL
jgi:hypothetical protein